MKPYDELKVWVNIKKDVEVVVSIDELIENLNEMPLPTRWNYAARILNEINYEDRLPSNPEEFSDEKIELIENYLKKQLTILDKFKLANKDANG